jgi:hypothetical protein
MCTATKIALFNDLVGAGEQLRRNVDVERPGGLEIDDELEFGRLHDREEAGFAPLRI